MPRRSSEVAAELRRILTERKGAPFTMNWPFVYNLCDRDRFTDLAYEQLREEAKELGMIVGFGSEAVLIGEDEDFAPLGS